MTLHLVSYDIAAPSRLRRAAQTLEDHGRRLQQSVFLCALSAERMERLLAQLREHLECPPDHLFVLPICKRCTEAIVQEGTTRPLPGEVTRYIPG